MFSNHDQFYNEGLLQRKYSKHYQIFQRFDTSVQIRQKFRWFTAVGILIRIPPVYNIKAFADCAEFRLTIRRHVTYVTYLLQI